MYIVHKYYQIKNYNASNRYAFILFTGKELQICDLEKIFDKCPFMKIV